MKSMIRGKHGRATSSDMMEFLGLGRNAKLPKNGLPEQDIQGVRVYVTPQRVLRPGERKSSSHRIFAICNCGQHVPTGRLHQHKCKQGKDVPINIVVERYAHGWLVANKPEGYRVEVIERFAHEQDAKDYARDILNDCVESAERRAGWDTRA